MNELDRAFKEMERQIHRHTQKLAKRSLSVVATDVRDLHADFSNLEKGLLRYLKDEYLEKGSGPPVHGIRRRIPATDCSKPSIVDHRRYDE